MNLLTPTLRAALLASCERGLDGSAHDPAPLVKLFSPLGPATWLASELYPDGDTLFGPSAKLTTGLADLGFGCPELGTFSLGELARVRLPFGLGIERDIAFSSEFPLSRWAEAARAAGSILDAERLLTRGGPSGGD
ncbi:DUF2958 domain-containing protein [Novosphingobium naphthalenivorans]|uniref:DUF2958 domain-containing protein n=1 Tax=Novosphingobium naphthalenivorans TaxID=273168 RepID=UPI0008354D8F|nr:DUF2958 domain-containing protein [Novosphingobium naphthalenivorans]